MPAVEALSPPTARTGPGGGHAVDRSRGGRTPEGRTPEGRTPEGRTPEASQGAETDSLNLSPDGKRALQELKTIDQKVRAHEAAHRSAGAGLVRGGSFTYRKGPDGQMYAVGGEVLIDTSAVPDNPRATLAKMQQVQAAAMAPADPSPQDRAVAAAAAATAAHALSELARAAQGGRLDLSA